MFRLAVLPLGFAFGSVSFAFIFTKLFTGKSILSLGSGNPGTTNVMRSVGKTAGALTFVCDFLKAVAAMSIAAVLFPTESQLASLYAGVGAALGHDFSPFLGFRGGKGVAVTIAVAVCVEPLLSAALIPAAAAVLIYKKMSLGSVAFASSLPFAALAAGGAELTVLCSVLSLMMLFAHRSNFMILTFGVQNGVNNNQNN